MLASALPQYVTGGLRFASQEFEGKRNEVTWPPLLPSPSKVEEEPGLSGLNIHCAPHPVITEEVPGEQGGESRFIQDSRWQCWESL